jgi:hypothetical protein
MGPAKPGQWAARGGGTRGGASTAVFIEILQMKDAAPEAGDDGLRARAHSQFEAHSHECLLCRVLCQRFDLLRRQVLQLVAVPAQVEEGRTAEEFGEASDSVGLLGPFGPQCFQSRLVGALAQNPASCAPH